MKKFKETKEKNWILKSHDTDESLNKVKEISDELGINPIIAKLLYSRGYTDVASAKSFIYMESEMLSNPFLMKDMELGIKRVMSAIENGEKITIYGDYDVDGVTSVCTIYLYLKSKGADVEYYIPNRAGEGYGVSCAAIDSIGEAGTKLIITVDTGITANEEVEYAKSLGIDVIVTDHHECRSELPNAVAVINPHRPDCEYPFKELAGVGVVFKVITAVEFLLQEREIFGQADGALTYGERYTRMLESGESSEFVAYSTMKCIADSLKKSIKFAKKCEKTMFTNC